jgi:hypothetical protein
MGDVINRFADAYRAYSRAKAGIPEQEQAAQAAATNDLLKRAQLAQLAQQMGFAPGREARADALSEATIEQARAHAGYYDRPKPTAPTKAVERTVDLGDRIRTYFTDGTQSEEPKGAAPKAPGSGGDDGGAAANPFNVRDSKGNTRLVVRDKSAPGGLRFVDNIGGESIGPGPTADMRNVEYQAEAIEPAFALVRNSLSNLKKASAGLGGSVKGMIPGTDSNFAKTHFQKQATALLGAIVARQAGEGSRMSDEDRKAYSTAATIVDNQLLLPGGIEEAELRLNEVHALLGAIQARRRGIGASGAQPAAPAAGGVSPNVQRILDLMKARNGGR